MEKLLDRVEDRLVLCAVQRHGLVADEAGVRAANDGQGFQPVAEDPLAMRAARRVVCPIVAAGWGR